MIQNIKDYLKNGFTSLLASAKAYVLANKAKSALGATVAGIVLTGNTTHVILYLAELGIRLLGKLL